MNGFPRGFLLTASAAIAPSIGVRPRPRRGREEVKKFMVGLLEAFHDLEFHSASDLIADGDYVVDHCEGGGTYTPDRPSSILCAVSGNSGRTMRLAGRTGLRVRNDTIAEEMTRVTWPAKLPKSCCPGYART
jgi:hypothetical protein